MYYYLSDLHLFHKNIIHLCDRPFDSAKEMAEEIIKNWKKRVTDEDTVFILGDVGLYHVDEIAEILNHLPGKKVLIKGNHDIYNLKSKTFRNCFEKISSYLEVKDDNDIIALFHYPIEEWNGFFRNRLHFHGHVHNKEENLKKIPGRYNVSVDVLGYSPRTKEEIISGKKGE